MPELFDQIQEARQVIQKRWTDTPRVGIILGTGLGGLVQDIAAEATIPFEDIPHFLRSTVTSHAGNFVCGKLAGKAVVAMEGRIHAYEGYSLKQLTFPVRIMKALGCEILIASNACGGMNPQFSKGDLMLVVGTDQRVVTQQIDMVLDDHEVALAKLRVHAAASVAGDEDLAAQRFHDAHGKRDRKSVV